MVAAAGSGLGASYGASDTAVPSPTASKETAAVPLVAVVLLLLLMLSTHGVAVVPNRDEEEE